MRTKSRYFDAKIAGFLVPASDQWKMATEGRVCSQRYRVTQSKQVLSNLNSQVFMMYLHVTISKPILDWQTGLYFSITAYSIVSIFHLFKNYSVSCFKRKVFVCGVCVSFFYLVLR